MPRVQARMDLAGGFLDLLTLLDQMTDLAPRYALKGAVHLPVVFFEPEGKGTKIIIFQAA